MDISPYIYEPNTTEKSHLILLICMYKTHIPKNGWTFVTENAICTGDAIRNKPYITAFTNVKYYNVHVHFGEK